ncbi:hypothetical protein [uncultured Clostridium sp.]|nr:hypothetical protein [uncultured Clostridium sp.]
MAYVMDMLNYYVRSQLILNR